MEGDFETGKKMRVKGSRIVFKHVFSLERFYKRLRFWLIEEGFIEEGSSARGDQWMEPFYLEKVSATGAKEQWIYWRTYKDDNAFVRFYIDIDFHTLGLMSHEIVHEGTKVKMNKGELDFTITGSMQIDHEDKWNKNILFKNAYIKRIYVNKIMRRYFEANERELVKLIDQITAAARQYLQIGTWVPEFTSEPYHPALGK